MDRKEKHSLFLRKDFVLFYQRVTDPHSLFFSFDGEEKERVNNVVLYYIDHVFFLVIFLRPPKRLSNKNKNRPYKSK